VTKKTLMTVAFGGSAEQAKPVKINVNQQVVCKSGAPIFLTECGVGCIGNNTVLPNNNQTDALRNYADQVGTALKGTVALAGGKAEVVCYADI
jgi:hypothetical protein